MTLYEYVAGQDPDGAFAICKKYGYIKEEITDESQLADCLEETVACEGEPALNDVLDIHPDKEIILTQFQKKNPQPSTNISASRNYNASGTPVNSASQTNTIILVSALIIFVAIVSSNK